MKTTAKRPASRLTIGLNKTKTFFSKPYNVILLLMGIVFIFVFAVFFLLILWVIFVICPR